MADPALWALAAACPATRPATPGDAVAGVVPRYVASPATAGEASALLRTAAGHGLATVPRGAGTKLDWGAPPRRCDVVIDTGRLDQVLEHAAGDLVARVQAGVPVQRLGEVLARAGQQLALDPPPGGPGGTIGGTLATAAAGPRRLRYGTPRDLVIGITVIRADGTVARSGGKVVKNVAGYDLGKLFAGSYGTLGLIVEAVFRLHPLPAGVAHVTVHCPDPAAAYRAVAAAVEIDRAARDRPVRVCVLLEGDPDGVRERAGLMCGLLGAGARTSPAAPAWWGWPDGAGEPGTLVRVAFWAAALSKVLAVVDAAAADSGLDPAVGGSAAAGVIYARLGADADPAAVAGFVAAVREALARGDGDARPPSAPVPDSPPVLASAVVVRAPAAVRELVYPWGPLPSLGLMRAVKDQFDPEHLMAPGRFTGGL